MIFGILCAVREGMEAGDGGSTERRREAKIRQKKQMKKEIKSTAVETGKGYTKEEAVTGRGNKEPRAG